ncbi:MAG: leucine-rich repeat domain-containing protein [Ignavibacteria bacterium]|jgi:hypothetical protein|nr:leucine-rich repeat domain-containing protein [Ignavibacteria bacterium]
MRVSKNNLALIALVALFALNGYATPKLTKEALDEKYASQWSEYQERANTQWSFPNLNQEEQDFIYYMNLARLNPQLFANTYLKDYECPAGYADTKLFKQCKESLTKYLKTLEPRANPIYPDSSISDYVCNSLAEINSTAGGDTLNITQNSDYEKYDLLGADFNTVSSVYSIPKHNIYTGFDLAMMSLINDELEDNTHKFICRRRYLIDSSLMLGITINNPAPLTSVNKTTMYAKFYLRNGMSKSEYILKVLEKVEGEWEPATGLKELLISNQLTPEYKEYLYEHFSKSIHNAVLVKRIEENGELSVESIEELFDFAEEHTDLLEQIKTLTIAGEITEENWEKLAIGENFPYLISASFPEATSIGSGAFFLCKGLTSASFPNATTIGSVAFFGCSNLTSVSVPNATSIEMRAFYGCKNLTSLSFPKVTSIGQQAFNEFSKLASITFGSEISHFVDSSSEATKNELFSNWDDATKQSVTYTEQVTLHLLNPAEYAKANGNEWRGYKWKNILKK